MKARSINGYICLTPLIAFLCLNCKNKQESTRPLEDIAANEEVLTFMKTFDGRGALSDSSQPSSPEGSLALFQHPENLKVELVLSEPDVTQPVFMEFDHRGRLWVVQYNQYPYPKDLKVTAMDQHIRATFDKIPPPPKKGSQGADKVTFYEDADGDGLFEKSTDAITGLNIATSVAFGRGHIWVLNPPYLLAYPDANDDGLPDSDPVVHLRGFGIEDTHAVANNLRWGPDGWLYGAQGSTCTANVSSAVSHNVRFDGQAIWRYHPKTKIFEVFAEGGGNTFDIEIDSKGRFYSGDNGTSRGQYFKQGAYYVRNFGKHGALTNPYAFGYLQNMELKGERIRFTHAFIKYEGNALPKQYEGKMIAINPLQSYVQLSSFEPNGSSFRIIDESRLLQTKDKWFRPVDITTGPDGGVYIADWYDSRLSHVDPRDTWSKSNGRIYRIKNVDQRRRNEIVDLAELSGKELVHMLSHENRWFRQKALQVLADRRDTTVTPQLMSLLSNDDGQLALEALWALHLIGGLTDEEINTALKHIDPHVRMWGVRLVGEQKTISNAVARALDTLAKQEAHPEVRSQLAASAKRFPGAIAVRVLNNLLFSNDDTSDPDIPLQIWWALESKVGSNDEEILGLFEDRALWKLTTVREFILERLMQRYAMQGDARNFAVCARLIKMAPSVKEVKLLVNGMQEGLRGQTTSLPSEVQEALRPYEKQLSEQSLALAMRQGNSDAIEKGLKLVSDRKAPLAERLACIQMFGEVNQPNCVPVLLQLVESNQSSPAIKQSSLESLQRYDSEDIGRRVVKAYPDKLRSDAGVRHAALSLLTSRPEWTLILMEAIAKQKQPGENFIAHTISREDVPDHLVQQIRLMADADVTSMAQRVWPAVRLASTSEKTQSINQVRSVLQVASGEISPGKKIFMQRCGACHRLFEEGGTLGPDLTGYDRKNINDLIVNIVDPNAFIREGYVSYRVTTKDGRVLSGTITDRQGNLVTLKLFSGETITLSEQEIKEMEAQPSLMPDNLLAGLTDQQLRDLFAYLSKQ